MNILDGLPTHIIVKGVQYQIHTSFKVWLKLLSELLKSKQDDDIVRLISSVFIDEIEITQYNINDIYQQLIEFTTNAKSYINATPENSSSSSAKDHDIQYDSNYIYSAFLEQYGVDLIDEDMHYYKYIALLDCLSETTLFKRIVGYRIVNLASIKDEKQRTEASKMMMIFKLPDEEIGELTEEEKAHIEKWSL